MRKDVRIGLAIGGILFIVVLSYVLFFTGPKPKQVGDARTNTPAKSANPERTATHEDAAGANPGSSNNDIAIAPPPGAFNDPIARTQTPTTPSPAPAPSPGTDNTPAPAPAPAPAATDWASILEHGEGGVARIATPATPPATPSDPVVPPPDPGATPPTATPPSTVTPPPAVPGRTHLVKQGESYWSIAEAEYGNGAYMSHLIRANPKYPPNKLRAGVSITIPPKDQVVRTGNGAASSPVASGPTTRPIDATKQYRVKSGDSLFSISKALYGKIDRVDRIYELNRDTIGPDPHVLKLGTVLQLPEPPKSATAAAGPVADVAH